MSTPELTREQVGDMIGDAASLTHEMAAWILDGHAGACPRIFAYMDGGEYDGQIVALTSAERLDEYNAYGYAEYIWAPNTTRADYRAWLDSGMTV